MSHIAGQGLATEAATCEQANPQSLGRIVRLEDLALDSFGLRISGLFGLGVPCLGRHVLNLAKVEASGSKTWGVCGNGKAKDRVGTADGLYGYFYHGSMLIMQGIYRGYIIKAM